MRVRIDNPVVVDPSRLFSGGSIEIGVLTRGGADAGPRTPRGGLLLQQNDPNPERLFLANTLLPSFPILNVGDGFAGSVVGVVGYSFDDFKILVSDPLPPVTRGGIAQEITPLTRPDGQPPDGRQHQRREPGGRPIRRPSSRAWRRSSCRTWARRTCWRSRRSRTTTAPPMTAWSTRR